MQTRDLCVLTCYKVLFSNRMLYRQLISNSGITFLYVCLILIGKTASGPRFTLEDIVE